MTYNRLVAIILEMFDVQKHIKIFSFYKAEITDTSDLKYIDSEFEKNKILFFTYSKSDLTINQTFTSFSCDFYILKCFKIISSIGEGGFGKVYLVEQKFTKEKYAMKIMKYKHSKNFIFRN